MSTSNNALLDLLARSRDANDIVMLKDLEAVTVGRRAKVTGLVSDVTRRYTREQKPFAIVSLVLMDGTIEVFVWDEKLQETEHLWQDGKLVAVTGNVRQRDDELSLSCLEAREVALSSSTESTRNGADSAIESENQVESAESAMNGAAYTPEEPAEAENVFQDTPAIPTASTAVAEANSPYIEDSLPEDSPVNDLDRRPGKSRRRPQCQPTQAREITKKKKKRTKTWKKTSQRNQMSPSPPLTAPITARTVTQSQTAMARTALPSSPVIGDASTPAEASRRLLLRLIEGDPEHDKRMLYDLRSILMDYRGDSEVTLEIATSGQIVEMEWPAVRVLGR